MNLNEAQLNQLSQQLSVMGLNFNMEELTKFIQLYQVMNTLNGMGTGNGTPFKFSLQKETNEELMEKFFLKLKTNKRSKHTLKNYREALVPYFEWLGDKKASDITFDDALNYIIYLRREENGKRVLAGNTINNRHGALCSFYSYIVDTLKYADTNYFTKKHIQRLEKKELNIKLTYLTQEEADLFLNTILTSPNNRGTLTRVRDYVMYRLMLTSGLRIQEAINLKFEDLDFEKGILYVKGGKGDKDRETMLDKDLEPIMGLYLKEREKLNSKEPNIFLNQNGRPVSSDTSLTAVKRYAKEAGIWRPDASITNHTLRHTFATTMITKGYALTAVSKMLGHASESFSYQQYVKNTVRELPNPKYSKDFKHDAFEQLSRLSQTKSQEKQPLDPHFC